VVRVELATIGGRADNERGEPVPTIRVGDGDHLAAGTSANASRAFSPTGSLARGIGKTTVLLADDHHLYREGLRHMLEGSGEVSVVAEASDGEMAVQLAREAQPRVVLIDLNLPILDGIRATEAVIASCPNTSVVVLTMYWEDEYASQLVRAGARGYLLKSARSEDVLRAVRLAASGGSGVDPSLAPVLLREYDRMRRHTPEGRGGVEPLTRREVSLLRLLADGRGNRQIAAEMGLAESTVRNNLSTLFQRIGVRDRTQAVLFAFSAGLVSRPADYAI